MSDFVAIITFIGNSITKSKNLNLYLFLLFCFISQIGIALQVIPLGRATLVADRYMYLPLIFLLALIIISLRTYLKKGIGITCFLFIVLYFLYYNQQLIAQWEKMNSVLN
ncbi:hypothetical protein [Sphingobacterium luzhongxinii]|uniref:hypothetical protein n=1 Tax=Sphingobacterium luzhongxinii TaxID=2654181 RepID=UPI0013D936AF|nr:hypothetical protein [Sphingobacterium sp. xlx-183]